MWDIIVHTVMLKKRKANCRVDVVVTNMACCSSRWGKDNFLFPFLLRWTCDLLGVWHIRRTSPLWAWPLSERLNRCTVFPLPDFVNGAICRGSSVASNGPRGRPRGLSDGKIGRSALPGGERELKASWEQKAERETWYWTSKHIDTHSQAAALVYIPSMYLCQQQQTTCSDARMVDSPPLPFKCPILDTLSASHSVVESHKTPHFTIKIQSEGHSVTCTPTIHFLLLCFSLEVISLIACTVPLNQDGTLK